MRHLLTVMLSVLCTAVYAQMRINGRPVVYDYQANTMMVTIPQQHFGSSRTYTVELDEGWSDLRINGSKVNGSYFFRSIAGGKTYPMTIRNRDMYVITSSITFTFLPIVHLEGDFGYDYQQATVSVYMPDEASKAQLTGKIKWRGGTTNAADKHKRNYKIKFDDDVQFFGLRKDDSWILDAGQADLFRLRNRIATELWNDMARKPYYADQEPEALSGVRGRVVELFLNREYRGIYCLTEAMDRKEMKLKKVDKNTGEIRGVLYKGESYGTTLMYQCPATYDNQSETWENFEVKYPELDDAPETDWSTLWNAIHFVVNSSNSEFIAHAAEYFDLPVLIDYHIFMNVLNVFDNDGKNMYWAAYDQTKDKKLTLAVWDLDASVGQQWVNDNVPGTSGPWSPDYAKKVSMNVYERLIRLNVDNFNQKVIDRYHDLRPNLLSTDQLTARYISYFDAVSLSGAAAREEALWSEDTDIKGRELNFESEIYYITYWLARHMQYLDEHVFKPTTNPTDGIREVKNSYDTPASASGFNTPASTPVYNLNGQKINRLDGMHKGIYIKDGKKYIVR